MMEIRVSEIHSPSRLFPGVVAIVRDRHSGERYGLEQQLRQG